MIFETTILDKPNILMFYIFLPLSLSIVRAPLQKFTFTCTAVKVNWSSHIYLSLKNSKILPLCADTDIPWKSKLEHEKNTNLFFNCILMQLLNKEE